MNEFRGNEVFLMLSSSNQRVYVPSNGKGDQGPIRGIE
jgi:hypothetical protein